MFKGCLSLFLLLYLVSAQAAEIYSWRDQDGVMHFGEKPPENAQELKKKVIADAPPNSNPVERNHIIDSQRLLRAFDEERAEHKQQKAKEKAQLQAEEKKREEPCRRAKKELDRIENGSPYVVVDEQGQEHDLNADEDQEFRRRLRETIAQHCDR